MPLVLASIPGPSGQWTWVAVPVVLSVAATVAVIAAGRPAPAGGSRAARLVWRLSSGLERLVDIPGWAASMLAVGLLFHPVFGLLGFYVDVSWHLDYGRDKVMFTPPHTMVVISLLLIPLAALAGTAVATVTRADVGWRVGRLRIPWSALPLVAFGVAGMVGFPLDDLWHAAYGVDVTLWSPTHLLMVLAGSLSDVALWIVVVEAGIRPGRGRGSTAVCVALAALTLVRLSTVQAEFDLLLPQFQALYLPVLVALAGAIGLSAARIVLGRGGALAAAAGYVAIRAGIALMVGPVLAETAPRFAFYVPAALAIEAAAAWLGTERATRFAAVAAAGTVVGLAGEAWWATVWGPGPWVAPLLPAAVVVGVVAAAAGAVLGVGLGAFVAGDRRAVARPALIGAGVAAVVALAMPFPRTAGALQGHLTLDRRGDEATVTLQLDPPDRARRAKWFETVAWQGGGLVKAPMRPAGPGRYVTARPVPVTGAWKTIVRLHTGTDLVALPVYLPADPEIRQPEVPAVNRDAPFVADRTLLMREAKAGPWWPQAVGYAGITAVAAGCAAVVRLAVHRVGGDSRRAGTGARRASAQSGRKASWMATRAALARSQKP